MSSIRKLTQEELDVFIYLNKLRESGVTNIFGSPTYVQERFDIDPKEARQIVSLWMTYFHEDSEAYESLLIPE